MIGIKLKYKQNFKGGIIADESGLGKTVIVLSALAIEKWKGKL